MPEAEAGEQVRDEFERVVSAVEEMTGLKSRWNGEVRVIQPQEQLFAPRLFTARKDWDCGLTVIYGLGANDTRWRVFIHEALHSVSVGLNNQDSGAHRGWEEGPVEMMQRRLRPDVLARLGRTSAEATSAHMEMGWPYEPYVIALRSLVAEFMDVEEGDFLRTLLGIPLRERKTYVFAWGRRDAADFDRFRRVYAAASGVLSR